MSDRTDNDSSGYLPTTLISTQDDVLAPAVFKRVLAASYDDGFLSLIEEIAGFSAAQKRTYVDISSEGVSICCSETFLGQMHEFRLSRKLDLRLRLQVQSSMSKNKILMLKRAGVVEVEVQPPAPLTQAQNDGLLEMNLRQLASVKWLHEQDIIVRWRLLGGIGGRAEIQDAETIEICRALTHIPPPDDVLRLDTSCPRDRLSYSSFLVADESLTSQPPALELGTSLTDAVGMWRSQYSPWTMTYTRGPGFIRIFDRRRGYSDAHFITLTAEQGRLLSFLELPQTFEAIRSEFSNIPASTLLSFVERLLDRELVVMLGSRLLQSFLVHRRQEEKWAFEIN